MADRYLNALSSIRRNSMNELSFGNPKKNKFVTFVTEITGEEMSDNDYLTILMDFYALYQKQNNRKAKMYCVMRMMQIEMARKKPWLRPMFPKVSFTEDPQAVLVTFVDRKRPFYQSLSDKVERKWLIFVTLLAMALIALLVLVCNLDFLFSMILVFVLWWTMLRIGNRYLAPLMMQDRIGSMIGKLDPDHRNFEKAMKFQNPPFVLFDLSSARKSKRNRSRKNKAAPAVSS